MNIEIANRLVNLRKEKGFSQEQLAEKIGVSRQAVSKWERSEASPDTDNLIMLARLYEVSLDELLRTEDEIPQPEETEQPEEQTPQAEQKEKADSPEPSADEQAQELPAENIEKFPEEQPKINTNNIGKNIAERASKMTDVLWLKLLIIVAAVPIAFFTSFKYGSFDPKWFMITVFSVELSLSIIDTIHFRDIGKFKMWALSMACAGAFFVSGIENIAIWLLLTPLYELIMWTVRKIRKK